MQVFVAPIGTGFGDVLISLPVVQFFLDQGQEVYLVTRSHRQNGFAERIEELAGEISEQDFNAKEKKAKYRYINLRDHPLQTDYCWGSPEFEALFGKTRIESIITKIAKDFDAIADYQSLKPLMNKPVASLQNRIAFVPGSDGFYKHWPHEYWLWLWKTLENAGQDCFLLGKPSESPAVARLIDENMHWHETNNVAEAVDAISACKAVVSVDTGLMHLAVQQGVKTFALVHPSNFHHRSASHCVNFEAIDCPSSCNRDATLKPGFMAASKLSVEIKYDRKECPLPTSDNCMAQIKPCEVLNSMKQKGVVRA